MNDSVNIGEWVRVSRVTISEYNGLNEMINKDAKIIPISDMGKYSWIQDNLVTIPTTTSAVGEIASIIDVNLYSVCRVCTRHEERCICKNSILSLIENRYVVKMLFVTRENQTHELFAYKKTLLENDVVKEDINLMTEAVVKQSLKHLLGRNDVEMHWFIPKDDKEKKKIISYIN